MTSPLIYANFSPNIRHFERMRSAAHERDRTMEIVECVRKGNIKNLFPVELTMNLSFDGVPVANFIDTVAHDMAEAIAPLPSLACTSGTMKTDADQKRASKKNRIGDWYWAISHLETQLLTGADRYLSYGFLPFVVEPDTDKKAPYIHVLNAERSYYEKDRYGNVKVFAHVYHKSCDEICALYPEYASLVRKGSDGKPIPGETKMEVVRWIDNKTDSLFMPSRQGLVLATYEHKLSRTPVVIAERPGIGDHPRGQFDDVVWTQVARAIFAILSLEAAATAVQAPIAIPADMDEFPLGPNALLQSDQAEKIHRVPLELPPTVFAEAQNLDQEMKQGARYPDARSGNVNASVITGKGVEALLGTYDTQIKGAQMVFKQALQDVTSLCFEMDEKWWPNVEKTVAGTLSGQSYEIKYRPKADINGQWVCTVTYGFAAGMHPSQSIVTMLQLEGAGLISHATTQENLPFDIDALKEQQQIDVENTREALKQGVFSLVQNAGPAVAQGQDPTKILGLAFDIVRARQNGKSMEDAVEVAFQNYQQAQAQQQQQMQGAAGPDSGAGQPDMGTGAPGTGGAGPAPDALAANGMPQGPPSVQNMIAGFRGNASLPINQMTIQRKMPVAG